MFWTVTSWGDVGDIAAGISLVAIPIALVLGLLQIRSQLETSRREAAFAVFLQFSDRFLDHMRLRSNLKDRFERKDTSLKFREIKLFYQTYWNIQINEWEMFRAGLLPIEIYASWLCYTHDSVTGKFNMGYFDDAGAPKSLTAKDAFTTIALGQMMRSQTDCKAFFEELASLPHGWLPNRSSGEHALQERAADISRLLRRKQLAYRKSHAWKLA